MGCTKFGRFAENNRARWGIEPATSSLRNRVTIEHKGASVHCGLSESIESPEKSRISSSPVLTRQNLKARGPFQARRKMILRWSAPTRECRHVVVPEIHDNGN